MNYHDKLIFAVFCAINAIFWGIADADSISAVLALIFHFIGIIFALWGLIESLRSKKG